jgi:hypothetical protein
MSIGDTNIRARRALGSTAVPGLIVANTSSLLLAVLLFPSIAVAQIRPGLDRVPAPPPAQPPVERSNAPPVAVLARVPVDADRDGIADDIERDLLARHTPYLSFSDDGGPDPYRPMDALNYVRWSALQADGNEGEAILLHNDILQASPESLLSQGTDLTSTLRFREDRFLDPLEDVPRRGANWARHGWDWPDVLSNRHVGLYGHVTLFRAASPQLDFLQCSRSSTPSSNDRDHVLCDVDAQPDANPPHSYYKIEYWQFFGYNGVGQAFDLGDHEGDWTSVQLLVDVDTMQIVQVHHFAHGYRFGFDLQPGRVREAVDLPGASVREYRGANWGRGVAFTWHDGPVAANANEASARSSQNNALRMMRDEATGEFTHPVVYVEHGGHEFWPTPGWSFLNSPNHNGEDRAHSYLAATPPNLGEVEWPLAEAAEAILVLRYNGRWGAYGRSNSSPQGPALHNGWTWPANSSLRWRLPKDLGN